MDANRKIVMLGTSVDAFGGIASVIDVYQQQGLFKRRNVLYMAAHCNGTAFEKLWSFTSSWLRYVGLLMRRRVALTHVHSATGTSFWRKSLYLLPTFLFGVPTILHLHAGRFPEFFDQECNGPMKWLFLFVGSRVTCIITVSDALRAWATGAIDNANIITVYNPVGLPQGSAFAGRTGSRILFLGKLGQDKGTYDLLAAIKLLASRHPDIRLVLGGDGDLAQTRAEINRLGLTQHVELPGWVSGDAKFALLRQAGIYVLPSYAEGLPMSVLEAMASGLVVVASTVGGIPEAVTNGREGILVQAGDVASLANALETLLNDDEARQRMGQAGREKVESVFASDVLVAVIEGIYDRLGNRFQSGTAPTADVEQVAGCDKFTQ